MIILDANILIYAYDELSSFHTRARAWLETTFSGKELVGIPHLVIAAFLRITTTPKLPGQRFTIEEASQIVDHWLEQPNVRLLSPGEDHWALLRKIFLEGQAYGALVSDAQVAALTLEFGGILHTTDRDFARFPGLRWINPLG